jgi:hypothetical protein
LYRLQEKKLIAVTNISSSKNESKSSRSFGINSITIFLQKKSISLTNNSSSKNENALRFTNTDLIKNKYDY